MATMPLGHAPKKQVGQAQRTYTVGCRGGCPLAPWRVRAQAQPSRDDGQDRLANVEAMQEAMNLYQQAQAMAQRQVLQELMQMEIADMAYYKEDASSTNSSAQCAPSPATPAAGSIRREPLNAATMKQRLHSFWLEQGLQAQLAQRIAQEMVASGTPFCDTTLLTAQVQRLGRVIPGPVQDVVARDWKIVDAIPSTVARRLVQLVQLLPSSVDVAELACKHPRLLYCDDLEYQFEAVVNKLTLLHPSHSREEAVAMLAEHPELLFRMPHYMHARTLDELPMELQNLMVYTGQGLHQLHQLYSDSASPRFL